MQCLIQCVQIMAAQVYLEKKRARRFTQEPYIQPMESTNISTQRWQKSMTHLCKRVDHLKPWLVIWSCQNLKGKVSRALSRLLSEHGWIDSLTIAAYHIPNAVHPFQVPMPIEGPLFLPIKNCSVVDSIHQCVVLFPEKQDIKVGVKLHIYGGVPRDYKRTHGW